MKPHESVSRDATAERDLELPDDPRLMQAVQEYLHQLEAGRLPNRQELLRRYPDLAGPLERCLDGLELVHKAAFTARAATYAPPPGSADARRHDDVNATTGPSLGVGPGDAVPANPLGDFQILREIGRGGMGIVYEAVQLSLGRRVALKVLPFAATFDAKHLQRFHNEAHAAAQLHHTNIVPVYAVGCERGVHFYAMQLIEGQSLAILIQQLRQQAGKPDLDHASLGHAVQPGTPLTKARKDHVDPKTASFSPGVVVPPSGGSGTPPQGGTTNIDEAAVVTQVSRTQSTQRSSHGSQFSRRLARFMVQAAEALEHAHQMGVVHRDIKPANLLVDANGRLWITDFGLAHFHDDATGLTQTGDILGTLRYMSPEQASGRRVLLDHRTDVYSLGATMYELATLEPIFPGRNRQELLYQITHDEPRAPRAFDKTVPVELETIILKAVSKNPADRYGTAQELADDLERYLQDKPILAKRPSVAERARKWSRRHPSFVAAALLLLIFGLIGCAASTILIAREQARTKQAYEAEARQRARAENDFAQAQRSIEFFVQFSGELANNPAMEDVRRRLLETALDYYEDFLAQHGNEPSIQAELGASRERAASILSELSRLRGPTLLFIIKDEKVQDELKLGTEQRDRVDKLVTRQFEQIKDFCYPIKHIGELRNNVRQDGPKVREAGACCSVEDALAEILNQDQKQRFQQIALQVQQQGRLGFSDPKVVDSLGLHSRQREQIRKIQNDAHRAWAEHIFFGKKIAKPAEFWTGVDADILAVLDADQRGLWQTMAGKKLDVDLRPGYPFDGRDPRAKGLIFGNGGGLGPSFPPPPPPPFMGPLSSRPGQNPPPNAGYRFIPPKK